MILIGYHYPAYTVFNINLLKPYTPPSTFSNHIQDPVSIPEVVLEGSNVLKLKDIADVQKVGRHFDYLVEFLDKPEFRSVLDSLVRYPKRLR